MDSLLSGIVDITLWVSDGQLGPGFSPKKGVAGDAHNSGLVAHDRLSSLTSVAAVAVAVSVFPSAFTAVSGPFWRPSRLGLKQQLTTEQKVGAATRDLTTFLTSKRGPWVLYMTSRGTPDCMRDHLSFRSNDSHFLSVGDMSGLMTIGEPREDPLFEMILVASAARMNLTSRGRGLLFPLYSQSWNQTFV